MCPIRLPCSAVRDSTARSRSWSRRNRGSAPSLSDLSRQTRGPVGVVERQSRTAEFETRPLVDLGCGLHANEISEAAGGFCDCRQLRGLVVTVCHERGCDTRSMLVGAR